MKPVWKWLIGFSISFGFNLILTFVLHLPIFGFHPVLCSLMFILLGLGLYFPTKEKGMSISFAIGGVFGVCISWYWLMNAFADLLQSIDF